MNITYDEKYRNIATCNGRTVTFADFAQWLGDTGKLDQLTPETRNALYKEYVAYLKAETERYFRENS